MRRFTSAEGVGSERKKSVGITVASPLRNSRVKEVENELTNRENERASVISKNRQILSSKNIGIIQKNLSKLDSNIIASLRRVDDRGKKCINNFSC
jgi:hypothetical protein